MLRRLGTWLARPPGLAFNLAVLTTGLVMLWANTGWTGDGVWYEIFLTVFVWLPLGVVWLVRVIATERGASTARRWSYGTAPVIVTVTALLVLANVPRRIAFAASADDLARAASRVARTGKAEWSEKRVGFVEVRAVMPIDGGARLMTSGLMTPQGIAWHPDGPPPEEDCYFYEHRRGPWYDWTFCD